MVDDLDTPEQPTDVSLPISPRRYPERQRQLPAWYNNLIWHWNYKPRHRLEEGGWCSNV